MVLSLALCRLVNGSFSRSLELSFVVIVSSLWTRCVYFHILLFLAKLTSSPPAYSLLSSLQATASVDFETDQKIQHVIRDEFSESLVLTVAHRLLTVVRGTHIMVLDAGRVVEFDTPATLLRNREGVFRKMAEKAAEWRELREAAGLGEDE